MTQLKAIYEQYYRTEAEVRRKARPMAGLWGFGDDPRKNPCHQAFYDAVAQWVKAFDASDPARTLEAVRWILAAAHDHRREDVYWYLYAAQGLTLDLIPRLTSDDRAELLRWFMSTYPKRERFETQQQVCKALAK